MNAIQTITFKSALPTAGRCTLAIGGETLSFSWKDLQSAEALQSALEAFDFIGKGNVRVTRDGLKFHIEFINELGHRPIEQLKAGKRRPTTPEQNT